MKTAGRRLVTRQRTAILNALKDADAFLTAAEIHSALQRSGFRAGLSTVYRSLEMLAEKGEVDVIRHDEGSARYRMCREDSHHHHLRCRVCNRSTDLVDEELEAWASKMARRHRYANVSHLVELVGVCHECRSAG